MFILIFAQQFWNHQCLGFSFHLIFAQNERVTIIYTGWLRIEVSLGFRMFKVHRVPQGNWNWEPPEKTNIDIEKMLELKIEDSALKPWRAQSTSKDFALRKTSPEYHEIFFWFKGNTVLSHECSFQTLYLGFSKRSMFIPIEWSIMPFINLPTTSFHLWPHFSYSPKVSQVYTSQISSPGLPGQRPTCPVPGARVRPFPPPGRNERPTISHVWIVQKRIQHASSRWLNPTHFKKKLCQNWTHLQILRLFEQKKIIQTHHLGGFQTFQATWSPFSRTFGPRFQEGTNAGAWEGKDLQLVAQRLKATGKKNNCCEKTKVAEIYIYIYCTYKNYEWEWIFWRMIHVLFHPKMKSI